jgi:hypothetical protein
MPVPPIPVTRYLVPPVLPSVPEGFIEVNETLLGGFPNTINLTDELTLTLVVPNGLAHLWRDADPSELVSASDGEIQASIAAPAIPVGAVTRAPARLLLRLSGTTVASVPLVAGLHRRLPDGGDPALGVSVELAILGWELHAGSLRGPGDFGSRITLAWRRIDTGVDFYSELPEVPPFLYRLRDLAIVPQLFPKALLRTPLRTIFLKTRTYKLRF